MADTTFHFSNSPVGNISETDDMLSDILHSKVSMREKNRNLIVNLHRLISSDQLQTIKNFMNHDALYKLHPSLLKSILIITKQVEDIQPERKLVESILQKKI